MSGFRALLGQPVWLLGALLIGISIVLQLSSLLLANLAVVQPLGAIGLILRHTSDDFGNITHPPEYAFAEGKAYKTGAAAPLFVMVKLDPKTPGTDQGWVYGTTTADDTICSMLNA